MRARKIGIWKRKYTGILVNWLLIIDYANIKFEWWFNHYYKKNVNAVPFLQRPWKLSFVFIATAWEHALDSLRVQTMPLKDSKLLQKY